MYRKNTAHQLFNISEDIYKSFYHIVFWKFAEPIKLYRMDYSFLRNLVLENKTHTVEGYVKQPKYL